MFCPPIDRLIFCRSLILVFAAAGCDRTAADTATPDDAVESADASNVTGDSASAVEEDDDELETYGPDESSTPPSEPGADPMETSVQFREPQSR